MDDLHTMQVDNSLDNLTQKKSSLRLFHSFSFPNKFKQIFAKNILTHYINSPFRENGLMELGKMRRV